MYTYIIIDDEELIRKGTIKKLSNLEQQIKCIAEASDGKEGIELIKQFHPDFVILDIQMPGMNGMELLPYLAKNYPHLPLIVISGYQNFDYIKQAISSNALEYILKPFSREAIQKVVLKAIKRLEDDSHIKNQIKISQQEKEQAQYDYDIHVLRTIILGYQEHGSNLSSKKLSYLLKNHSLCLLAISLSKPIHDKTISSMLHRLGFEDLILPFSIPNNDTLYLFLLFIPQNTAKSKNLAIQQFLNDIIPQITMIDPKIHIGISLIHDSIDSLNTCYSEAISALNQQYVIQDNSQRYFFIPQTSPIPITWNKEDELLFRIEAGITQEVQLLTDELFDYYHTIPNCTLLDVKYHCYKLSDLCRQLLDEYVGDAHNVKSSTSMQNVVNNIFSIEDLKTYYKQFFLNLTKMIEPDSIYAIEDTIKKVEIYIQRNYQKNLSQEFLSSLFYINRSYLSTLFKKRTGKKFVDYLNQIRISKSIELLTNTDKKMYQIARLVGYDNTKYFFRIFKKQIGITPEEYRTIHSNKSIKSN